MSIAIGDSVEVLSLLVGQFHALHPGVEGLTFFLTAADLPAALAELAP